MAKHGRIPHPEHAMAWDDDPWLCTYSKEGRQATSEVDPTELHAFLCEHDHLHHHCGHHLLHLEYALAYTGAAMLDGQFGDSGMVDS